MIDIKCNMMLIIRSVYSKMKPFERGHRFSFHSKAILFRYDTTKKKESDKDKEYQCSIG